MITNYLISGSLNSSYMFLFEILICDVVLTFDKKKLKVSRTILGMSVFLIVLLFFPPFLPPEISQTNPLLSKSFEIIALIIYFLSISLISTILFDLTLSRTLFCAIASYAIQNCIYCVLTLMFSKASFINSLNIIREIIIISLDLLVSLLLRIQLKKIGFIEMNNLVLLSILMIVLFSNAILGVLSGTVKDSVIDKCYGLTVDLIILYLQFAILGKQTYQRKYYLSKMMWEKDKKNYELKKESIEDMNGKVHDLKHILASIQSKMDVNEFQKFRDSINKYENLTQTGSLPLDVVLADKWEYAKKHDVKLTFLGDGKELSFIEEIDLYSLFVNIIDNAFDAVIKLSEKEKRVINLTLTKQEHMLLLQCSNYTNNKIFLNNDGLIKTSKENKTFHGYGLKSINTIVKKYKGHMSIYPENNIFTLTILFNR